MSLITALRSQRQADLYEEFKASLVYIAIFRPAKGLLLSETLP